MSLFSENNFKVSCVSITQLPGLRERQSRSSKPDEAPIQLDVLSCMIPELSSLQNALSSFHSLACSHFVASSHIAPSAWKTFISPNLSHLTHFNMSRYNSDLHPPTKDLTGSRSWVIFIHCCTHRASTLPTHTHTHTHTQSLSCVRLFVTPWTVAHQAPLFMEFSRQEYWSGLPFPSPGDLPYPEIKPCSAGLLHCKQILYHLNHQ